MSETKFTEWINFINEEASAFEYNTPRPKFNVLLDLQAGGVINVLRSHFDLYAALEAVEWVEDYQDDWEINNKLIFCPFCSNLKGDGHKPDCQLNVALKRARGEK